MRKDTAVGNGLGIVGQSAVPDQFLRSVIGTVQLVVVQRGGLIVSWRSSGRGGGDWSSSNLNNRSLRGSWDNYGGLGGWLWCRRWDHN